MFQPGGVFYELLGPMAPVVLVGGLGIVLLLLAVSMLIKQRPDPMDKLAAQAKGQKTRKSEALRTGGTRNEKLDKYGAFLEPQDEEQYSEIAKKLMQAGYRGKDAVRMFHAAQVILGVLALGCGLGYYYLVLGPENATTQQMIMYILGPGAAGYYVPKYWITRRAAARHEEIEDGFPDALDMMLVCVEAGQSLDQSILRVSNEIQSSYKELAYEFQVVSHEIKAGKDKTSVLNDMGERCGVQDISSFVTVLIQAQVFGTSIAEALRVYAAEMRDKRVMRAEEKANKLPTKMTLVTMGLTVPPLLIILVGPSAMGIMRLGTLGQ
ncbi:type II secretion system F family protein [Marinovum sp. 2_MG-2023]|uniref:type II secretion system F family protein n=1 Tax=unclassified Marinovum TaxID=2647166 RepID=UPI0026E3A2E1|nr:MULTISPECIES: type II secretion system F family protein [unclassified Marinovum]MDO6731679.1 type II secretion system F family protein [Marinovum sp. 2_MG-2023]MDO6780931.1 type II secretion system F family protein [Marinovum sp. 1_MG-2023]